MHDPDRRWRHPPRALKTPPLKQSADIVEEPAPRTPDAWQPSRISPVAHLLFLIGAAAGIFLAGGRQDGNFAVFLMAAGVALLLCPPRIRVDGKVWLAAAALILSASLALLPQSWIGAPAWRRDLLAAGVPLPASISAMPHETVFWIAILAVVTCGALFALSHPVRSRMQLALAVAAVAICGVYAALAIYARQSGWQYPFAPDPQEFGFFLNRNHTSTFLVTGCVVALGILAVAFKNHHWFAGTVAAISLATCICALMFFTKSRGGIVTLLAGTLVWGIGLGTTHRSKPLLVSFAAVFVGGILLLFSSPGIVRDRLLNLSGSVKDRLVSTAPDAAPLDGRVPIFTDTVRMLGDYAITGVGLGNFRFVFPMYRQRALWEAPVIHPESDWLLMAVETGIPSILALVSGIALLVRAVWPLRRHPYWPLRWALLCAALAALLHGFVDVPAHRSALAWWILVVACLGFQSVPRLGARPSRIQHGIFILAGCGAIALSVFLMRATWFGGRASPPFAAADAEIEIIGLRFDGKKAESIAAAHRSIATFPLADRLHYQLGLSLLRSGRSEEAATAFRNQSRINPMPTAVMMNQGEAWLETDPERTGDAWLEAVTRRLKIDLFESGARHGSLALYRDLLGRSAAIPAIQTRLLAASDFSADFTLAWLDQAGPALVAAELPKLAANAGFVELLAEPERHRFLQVWYRRGDRERLFAWLAGKPEWRDTARPITLRRLVDAGKFSEAVEAASSQFGFRLDIPEPGGGERDAPATAPEKAREAFEYYWRIGNVVTAKRTLEDARAEKSPIDPEIWRLSAAVSARENRWDSAWQYVERYLRAAQPDSFP